jgi:hypothetical protein
MPLAKDLVTQLTSTIDFGALAGSFAFGTIRWPRASAKLLTPRRGDAFEITLNHSETFLDHHPDGVYFKTVHIPDYPPSKSDGPDDDEYLRVSFFAAGLRRDTNYTVGVQFTPLAKWAHTVTEVSTFHTIAPASRNFRLNDGAVIDPFDVISELFPLPVAP